MESWNEYNRVLFDTREYAEFIEAVKAQGGQVTHTTTNKYGRGLSVYYRLPGKGVNT